LLLLRRVLVLLLAAYVLNASGHSPTIANSINAQSTVGSPQIPAGYWIEFGGGGIPISGIAPLGEDGSVVNLGDYQGRALLLNIWATWCPPCIAEMPSLGKLQTTLTGQTFDVVAIAVAESGDRQEVAQFLASHGAAQLRPLYDANHTLEKALPLPGLPSSLLIDRGGFARAIYVGDSRWSCGEPLEVIRRFIERQEVPSGPMSACPN